MQRHATRATAAAITTGLVAATAGAAAAGTACSARADATEAHFSGRVVELVNEYRRSLGLRAVRVGPALIRSATWKAAHMARYRYVAHTDLPGVRTVAHRLRSCGYRGSGWGEVLAAGHRSPRSVVRAWLASSSHRAVLGGPWWRVAGAGVAQSRNGALYWALDFGA